MAVGAVAAPTAIRFWRFSLRSSGKQIDACDARVIVDGDVSELVAGTVAALVASFPAGDTEAGSSEFAELFDVDVDGLAGGLTLVARAGLTRLDRGEPAEAVCCQETRHGRQRQLYAERGRMDGLWSEHLRERARFLELLRLGEDGAARTRANVGLGLRGRCKADDRR